MTARPSPWQPLHVSAFRSLWIAQLVSNVGTWMHLVAAQWQVAESGSSVLVGLVQTATSLPVLLLAVTGGWLGDVLDRRRVLLVTNVAMLLASLTLGMVTLIGAGTPLVVLGGTALLGVGTAVLLPTWQAIIPSLVGRENIAQAAALGGVSINLARVVGPAIGGVGVALLGPGWVFLVNGLTFAAMVVAAWKWRAAAHEKAENRPRWTGGFSHLRDSRDFRVVLALLSSYTLPASAPWALLPVVARAELGASSEHYGVLLTSAGVGAIVGAAVLPGVIRLAGAAPTLCLAFLVTGLSCLSVPTWGGGPVWLPALAMVCLGIGWLSMLSSLNVRAHHTMPDAIRARGMSVYVMSHHGAQAVGGLLWGTLASLWTAPMALVGAGSVLVLTAGAAGAVARSRRGR